MIVVLPYLAKKHNHILKRYDFCEPQTGKDICNRKVSALKKVINNYIERENDVVTAEDIKKSN